MSNQTMISSGSMSNDQLSPSSTTPSFPLTLWRFTRPHTLIGSAIAIPSLHFFAAPNLKTALSSSMFLSLLICIVPSLLMNVYITGLNQIVDVEIDKINKPYLPIAAGHLSLKSATLIVNTCLISSLLLGAAPALGASQGLNVALWGSGILGTMYSLEPFRLKRFPLLAAFCIVAVRGMIVNAGFYAHALVTGLGRRSAGNVLNCLMTDKKCLLSCVYFGIFGVVIALMKDVPDVKGDAIMNIRSFSVRVGPKAVFGMVRRLVSLLFLTAGVGFGKMAVDATAAGSFFLSASRWFVCGFGCWMGWKAWKEGKDVNAENSEEVYGYYMELW
eukprot:CAMPEP_0172508304 /NCGR_PEP_ID=MMETSP1066-20121228/210868_1 /TAXON_ID=671091 /ORGANISM="Coscinodiscus wailesii, Strain CCMP2513" /LENGTH=329 /DNA_ID=CAMNT_0013286225 /DNA_START=334 /DNA_END=1320 /DNA_ORIENTATION=-